MLGKPLEKLEEWTLGRVLRKDSVESNTSGQGEWPLSHKREGECQGQASEKNEF